MQINFRVLDLREVSLPCPGSDPSPSVFSHPSTPNILKNGHQIIMAVQYLEFASGNALWCGILFTLRALIEVVTAILSAPFAALYHSFFVSRRDDSPSVHHSGTQTSRSVMSTWMVMVLHEDIAPCHPSSWDNGGGGGELLGMWKHSV